MYIKPAADRRLYTEFKELSMPFYRVVSPFFVAGFNTMASDKVDNAAPIIHYFIGKDIDTVLSYCKMRKWEVEKLTPLEVLESSN